MEPDAFPENTREWKAMIMEESYTRDLIVLQSSCHFVWIPPASLLWQ